LITGWVLKATNATESRVYCTAAKTHRRPFLLARGMDHLVAAKMAKSAGVTDTAEIVGLVLG
jgi:hypothetical protein